MNTVITLKHGSGYSPDQGACFEVHFEKSRDAHGDDVAPFSAQLMTNDEGKQYWITAPLVESNYERTIQLIEEGLSQADIARKLNVGPPAISKHVSRARENGRIEA